MTASVTPSMDDEDLLEKSDAGEERPEVHATLER